MSPEFAQTLELPVPEKKEPSAKGRKSRDTIVIPAFEEMGKESTHGKVISIYSRKEKELPLNIEKLTSRMKEGIFKEETSKAEVEQIAEFLICKTPEEIAELIWEGKLHHTVFLQVKEMCGKKEKNILEEKSLAVLMLMAEKMRGIRKGLKQILGGDENVAIEDLIRKTFGLGLGEQGKEEQPKAASGEF